MVDGIECLDADLQFQEFGERVGFQQRSIPALEALPLN